MPRTATSDVEWLKHVASEGFKFPQGRDRAGYAVDFIAGPDDPGVEHDLREFLDVIEGELRECAAMLGSCSDRWRDFPLPDRIDRSNIHSKGYKYGEHRFTLDRDQVLNLFMGENLYESPFAFIRELLQNAIDASRHREFHERSRGRTAFRADPIVVDEWTDEQNYRWIRVQDFGMGMDEKILTEFFLKVGQSYYRSAAFRADVLRYGTSDGVVHADQPLRDRRPLVLRQRGPSRALDAPRVGTERARPALIVRHRGVLHAPDPADAVQRDAGTLGRGVWTP